MKLAKRQTIYGLIVAVVLLIGCLLIGLGSPVTLAVGTSLVASGIVGLLEILHRYLVGEESHIVGLAEEAGLIGLYNRRDLERYHHLMANATDAIDICGYSLRSFFDSFRDVLLAKANEIPSFRARILLVDPSIKVSKAREKAEQVAHGTFQTAMQTLASTFANCTNIEIRLLSEPLTTMVFRIDDTMFIGPQFNSVPSRAAPTFEVVSTRNSWLFKTYAREFDELWNVSTRFSQG